MDEKPKSIWKKSWKGLRLFLIWLVLMIATMVTLSIGILIIGKPFTEPSDFGVVLISGGVGASFLFGLWLFVRWLCCWRNFKRFLFGLACFITFIALFYAEEDWRGWHAWNKFKHEWEAKGERFDRASVIPPTVPDDQNFALTPIVASCYEAYIDKNGHAIRPPRTNVVNRLQMPIARDDREWPTNGIGNWQKAILSNLKPWQDYYRSLATITNLFPVPAQPQSPAADVLFTLSKYDSTIEELRRSAQLSYSRFPLEYDAEIPTAILLPHLSSMKGCSQILRLRSIAELQNGQSELALADVKLLLRLTDSMRTEPFLISHLVRIAMMNIALQPVWEGLSQHQWSDGQLVEIEKELAKQDFPADYKVAMRGEMVLCQVGTFDWLRRHPEQFLRLGQDEDISPTTYDSQINAARLIPSGWFYQNQLHCAQIMVKHILPLVDVNRGIVSPEAVRHAGEAVGEETKRLTPYNIFGRLLLPALSNAAKKFAYSQSSVDLARTAIALERYRLARGEYPESLDALAPQFISKLPHDIINGQPLHYRRTSDGQFVLYSVGWNETDDGGEVGFKKDGAVDINNGDWVWRYPAK